MIEFVGEQLPKKQLKLFKRIANTAFRVAGQKPRKVQACVEFVYDEEMHALNKAKRNIDASTDVLSFPTLTNQFNRDINAKNFPEDVNPENGKVLIGDVVINLNRAEEQAGSFGHSLTREIGYLLVHGLLHLMGYDHIDALDANLMFAQTEKVLAKYKLKRA